jgi:hypothetical protein
MKRYTSETSGVVRGRTFPVKWLREWVSLTAELAAGLPATARHTPKILAEMDPVNCLVLALRLLEAVTHV